MSSRSGDSFTVPAYLASLRYIGDAVLEHVCRGRLALEPILCNRPGFVPRALSRRTLRRGPTGQRHAVSGRGLSRGRRVEEAPPYGVHVAKAGRQFHGPRVLRQLAIHRGLGARGCPPGRARAGAGPVQQAGVPAADVANLRATGFITVDSFKLPVYLAARIRGHSAERQRSHQDRAKLSRRTSRRRR